MEIETQKLLDTINKQYPVNSIPIKYKNEVGIINEAKVRFPAEVLESGKAVIWLNGEIDAIDLKYIII